MAPKRTAPPATKATRAKIAKVDPAIERCQGVLTLLSEFGASKLPTSCLNMLRETAPLALSSARDQRHKYEIEVVNSIGDLCGDVVKDQAALVREAEGRVEECAAEKEHLDEQLTKLCAEEQIKREAKNAAAAALELASKTEQDTKASVEAAQKEIADTERHIAVKTAAKEKFETTFVESWPPLRDGTFSSKDWRARNKVVAVLVPMLTAAPESLRSGLSQALKEKPEARGEFASKTIEFAEAAFKEHTAGMASEIDGLNSALEGVRTSLAEAEVRLQADTKAKDDAWEASIAAENAWVEADSEVFSVKSKINNFETDQAAKVREVDNQKAMQQRVKDLVADFETLRDFTGAVGEPAEAEGADANVTTEV